MQYRSTPYGAFLLYANLIDAILALCQVGINPDDEPEFHFLKMYRSLNDGDISGNP